MSEQIFNLTHDEIIGKHCWEIVHGTKQPIPECPVLRVKRSLSRESMELQIGRRWFAVYVDPILDADGQISGYVHIVSDITGRKRTENALKESEIYYRALVESSPDAITQTDLNGRILMCNAQTALLHGYNRPEDLIGKSAFDLFPPDELERAGLNLQKTLTGEVVKNIEYRFLKKDGSCFHGDLSATAITDVAGKPISFMAITRDITERKLTEKFIRESEEKYRVLFEGSAHGILSIDIETGRFVFANPSVCRMLGYSEIEMRRLGIADRRVFELKSAFCLN
jgi:PAS domain S-box-containing protein